MLKGYVAAYPEYVQLVPGGVIRTTQPKDNKVIVINGGGSGHYPAFCGIIGNGFMDGTVVGNVFTSPSTENVLNVAHALNQHTGIFIVGGNYAGDKMNFNLARDVLIREGNDCRTFYITDDVASADVNEIEKRRGNVGTFMVFKAAGAAAQADKCFDEVYRLTSKANDRTRTMSIGFKGCTLPGQDSPLFEVPKNRMEIGQGIHGEPGVGESDLVSAAEVAKILVGRVLAEAPTDDSKRLAVILDGLGSTKYEELFVVWGTVRHLLEEAGYTLVEPKVGEYVTSLDMQGIALAVEYLDPELEELWLAPTDTPAFKNGQYQSSSGKLLEVKASITTHKFIEASDESRSAAQYIVDALERAAKKIEQEEENLAKIDGVAGDGDHGRGMVKGTFYALEAAKDAYNSGAGVADVLAEAGHAWAAKAGGTSGVLWGEAIVAASQALDNNGANGSTQEVAKAVEAASNKMQGLGGAKQGDKTMLDTLIPFSNKLSELAEQDMSLADAWASAVKVAEKAAEDTATLVAKVGRARPAQERSLGVPDAGAVSMAMILKAIIGD